MKPIKFTEDKGVTRSSRMKFNRVKIEKIVKRAREWLDKHKGKICTADLIKIEQELGVQVSNANNFAWAFNIRNKHAPFSDLSLKYKIKVGAHYGRAKYPKDPKAKQHQENYFRDLNPKEMTGSNPERDKE